MLKMVDGTGIIGVDMVCPLGVSTPQPPNYDRVELEGAGMLVLPNSLDAQLERLELGGKTEQVQTTGKNLVNANVYEQGYLTSVNAGDKVSLTQMQKSFTTNMEVSSMQGKNVSVSVRTKGKTGKKYVFTDETDTIITGVFDTGNNNYSEFKNITIPQNAKKLFFSATYDVQENTELQVELGTTVTTYEPYTGGKPSPSPEYPQEIKNSGKWNEGTQKYEVDVKITNAEQNWSKEQTLTLTSDRPITKWDKLVEHGGEIGWLYNTDKYIVTGQESFETKPSYVMEETVDFAFMNNKQSGIRKAADNFCNRLTYVDSVWSKHDVGFGISGVEVHIRLPLEAIGASSSDESAVIKTKFSEYLKKKYDGGGPFVFYHKSKTTEFIPLPQSEQNAIRALKTYYPTTVITVDGGEVDPDIKVTYRKEI